MEGGRERKRVPVNGMQNDVYPINIRVGTYMDRRQNPCVKMEDE